MFQDMRYVFQSLRYIFQSLKYKNLAQTNDNDKPQDISIRLTDKSLSVMNQFFSFVRKEFYHIFRDKRTVLILLVMPIVQILLFGFAITTEVNNARVAVFDPSRDEATQHIKQRFQASPYFTLTDELHDARDINTVFQKNKADLVLVFTNRFADNMAEQRQAQIQLIADGTDPNQAAMLTNYATGILTAYQQETATQNGNTKVMQVMPTVRMLYNPQGKSAYNFVPGVMGLILMLICAMMTAISIVREKEQGTMEVLLASPVRPIYIILAKAVPYFLLSVVNLLTILSLAVFVLDVPVAGSLFWLMAVSFIFIFLALALGLLISTAVSTQMAAMLVSGMGLMMPVMLLSGMMFPIESMPKILQWISCAVPARWYIAAVKKIMIEGVDVRLVWQEIGILSLMATTFVAISLKKFNIRLNT